ncbi:hypothetical protein UFOVP160_46 [uncultured Caudovirales phage]|uniref:NrS-1 polymerase-like helicase domain-containing protein n=1 Tax=uncultured Caudovirales phage TaxID=2100421 RepID=A0A6J7WA01_9CAUD|nr:hypothetical protein UFOVP160_46 [uncultured Caudovirales phage]
MEFLDFITKLAPEGETALIVRQKPQLKDGEIQLHADGAVKCTWPAYLPSKGVKAGQAWYGNTASFIIDRFVDGRVSASAANCEYILVMMLDDIGTKSKTPPLEPTWIMETSPGSFQWGYAFVDQPTKAEFSAAIRAIADAGYTDPGACNPVRNFRLPGSVNLKPDRNNFESRLVTFHPEREYTLGTICDALGVVPVEADSLTLRPIRLSDDGADDVMAWLSQQGLLLSRPNGEGWAGVICPNGAEHTDGNPEGRYMPANRAYCCLHSHCVDFDSRLFLQWVADNGGPTHTPGLREELLAQAMDSALSKLTPTIEYPNEAAKIIAEVERKELGRIEKSEWWGRFAYIQADDAYFDLQDKRELARGTFNALFRHISCKSIHNGRKVEASYSFDEHRQAKGAKSLVGVTYAAGADVLVARDGLPYGNRWRDARPTPKAGDVSPWLAHVERMVPEEFEREHLLNALAHKVQFPAHKINHAILMGGNHGSGKDTLFAPFFWAIGGDAKANCSLVKNEDLNSQWGYALECEVMEIAELRQAEAKDRRALENTLKPIIAAPPELLMVNRKGMHPYMALNRVFVIAFSNERVAISLPSEDRRWFVLWCAAPKLPEAQAVSLWNWYQHRGGFEAVAHYLHTRDVSDWNPSAPPPMTEAKLIMVEHGMSTAESFLVDQMTRRVGEFSRGVIGAPFHAVCDRLQGLAPAGVKIVQAALLHALKEAGWVDMGRIASRQHGTKKHIFCAPDMVNVTKSELRALVEA